MYSSLTLPAPTFSVFWEHVGNSGHREELTSSGPHQQGQSRERSPIFLAPLNLHLSAHLSQVLGFFFYLAIVCLKYKHFESNLCIHEHRLPGSFSFLFTKMSASPGTLQFLSLDHFALGALPYRHIEEGPGASPGMSCHDPGAQLR